MDLRIEQECPQCGGGLSMSESDRLLTCPFCGVKSFMLSAGAFRYHLPPLAADEQTSLFWAPYLRFKGNVFLVNEAGIGHRVMDTTQLGYGLPGLPPSLGVRPQAMALKRVAPHTGGRYLRLTTKARVVLDKVIRLSSMRVEKKKQEIVEDGTGMIRIGSRMESVEYSGHDRYLHRAFIGETLSFVYLPLEVREGILRDAVSGNRIIGLAPDTGFTRAGTGFNPRWQVRFLPTLCPRCGWNLDGEGDCLVMTCANCDTAWALEDTGLTRVDWQMVAGDRHTALYLGFWKVSTHLPEVGIASFADFIQRTNQAMVARPQWFERVMSFWVPAFKLRPAVFLRAARQATLGQWRLEPGPGHVVRSLYPVTLPAREARQAVKVILAACAASRKKIFPYLPEIRPAETTVSLVFLPFNDMGHDWVQPHTSTTISKSVLRFGRSL